MSQRPHTPAPRHLKAYYLLRQYKQTGQALYKACPGALSPPLLTPAGHVGKGMWRVKWNLLLLQTTHIGFLVSETLALAPRLHWMVGQDTQCPNSHLQPFPQQIAYSHRRVIASWISHHFNTDSKAFSLDES